MTRLLVTGASGFLGRLILPRLAPTGSITALGRSMLPGYSTGIGDISQPGLNLGSDEFATVYHLAGWAHASARTAAEKEMFFRVNVAGTKNLLDALERQRQVPRAFVLISTVAVYGLTQGTLIDESAPPRATDAYGASKVEAERLVLEWCRKCDVVAGIARLPLVVGRAALGNLGAMLFHLKRGSYWGIGSGSARRSMVLGSDVGSILPRIAAVGGTFHLTDGYHPSFAELGIALAAALKRRAPPRLPLPIAKTAALASDVLQRATGWRAPFSSSILDKMTRTLTFSDERARRELAWKPSPVLEHAADLVA